VTANACVAVKIMSLMNLTLVDLMPKFFNMFVGPLAASFFVGMFLPRCTTRSALPAMLLGLVVSIFWNWWPFLVDENVKPTPLLAIALPCATTVATAFLLSFVVERRRPHAGQAYTWREIVRR
jgi:Na+/proline symporter